MGKDEIILERKSGGNNTNFLFLGLYLLILTFFILLVSISSLEEVRSQQIMHSLSSTFKTLLPPSTELTPFQKDDGRIIAGQAFQERVTDIFATSLQIAKVDVARPGRSMKVSLPTSALFKEGEVEIRTARLEILDLIVAALSVSSAGVRHDLQFVIGSEFVPGTRNLPVGETLEMGRAGAFAREMLSRGAPPDSVGVGIRQADPAWVDLWFHTREQEEDRFRFDYLLKGLGETDRATGRETGRSFEAPQPGSSPIPDAPSVSGDGASARSGVPDTGTGFVAPLPPVSAPDEKPASLPPSSDTDQRPSVSRVQPGTNAFPPPSPPSVAIAPGHGAGNEKKSRRDALSPWKSGGA